MDELAGIAAGTGRRRVVEEGQVAGRVRRPDVQQQAERAVGILGAGRLEDLAGRLIDLRIAIGAERRVAGDGADPGRLGVDVVQPGAARLGIDERIALHPLGAGRYVVVLEIDQRGRARVRRLTRDAGSRVVDVEPLPVGPADAGAAGRVDALVDGGPAIRGGGGAQTGQRVEVRDVRLPAPVEAA